MIAAIAVTLLVCTLFINVRLDKLELRVAAIESALVAREPKP